MISFAELTGSFPVLPLPLSVIAIGLLMCGDVEINPGPLDLRELQLTNKFTYA